MQTRPVKIRETLTAAEVRATVAASGLTRLEFAESVGCGSSQLFKYQKEGLPPRMNTIVRANILRMAAQLGTGPTARPKTARLKPEQRKAQRRRSGAPETPNPEGEE